MQLTNVQNPVYSQEASDVRVSPCLTVSSNKNVITSCLWRTFRKVVRYCCAVYDAAKGTNFEHTVYLNAFKFKELELF